MSVPYAIRLTLAATALLLPCPAFAAQSYDSQTIAQIQFDARSCLFFNLNGVPVADSSVSNATWFAIPKSGTTYQEMSSVILSSKLSGKKIFLSTDGTASCGYATVSILGFD